MDLVFLHGGGQGSWIWDETLAALHLQQPGRHRTLALDIPGCGAKRGRHRDDISFPEIVAELAADIASAGLQDIVLVGHSQAGTVLPGLARTLPDRVRRLIYVSCVAPPPGQAILETARALHATRGAPLFQILGNPAIPYLEQLRAAFCNDMAPAEADAFLARLQQDNWPESALSWTDYSYDVPAAAPATYVLCLSDQILPPDAQRRFAERFACQRIVSIDAGHQAQNTRPHGLAEILLREAAEV